MDSFLIEMIDWCVAQGNKLVELEKQYPHPKIKEKLIENIMNGNFECPASALEIPKDEVKEWGRKAMAYSNFVWGLRVIAKRSMHYCQNIQANFIVELGGKNY